MVGADEFRATVRRGARSSRPTLVAHVVSGPGEGPSRVGFVVSKAVGPSVDRNRVKRRLRHVVRDEIGSLPDGSRLVVRALPAAASASSVRLRADLVDALARAGTR